MEIRVRVPYALLVDRLGVKIPWLAEGARGKSSGVITALTKVDVHLVSGRG